MGRENLEIFGGIVVFVPPHVPKSSKLCSQFVHHVFLILSQMFNHMFPMLLSKFPCVLNMCSLKFIQYSLSNVFLHCSQNSLVSPMLFPIVSHFPPYSLPKVLLLFSSPRWAKWKGYRYQFASVIKFENVIVQKTKLRNFV